jgi:SnoaL-like polyketide cyclase
VRGFGHHHPPSKQSLDEIVEQASTGKVSRRQLIATLTALGVSASATATVVGAAEWMHHHLSGTPGGGAPHGLQHDHQHQQLHQQHIVTQTQFANATPNAAFTPAALRDPALQARLDAIMHDYHPDAMVRDMLSGGSIQGHDAIRAHKAQEFLSFSNLDFEVTRRYAVQDQVVVEWVARGILHGEFKGLVGNGSPFEIPGVTLVSRDAGGKIVKESIYYNLAHVQRYLGTSPMPA